MTSAHRDARWVALVKRVRPRLQASIDGGGEPCLDCGGPIMHGQKFDVAHRLDAGRFPHLAYVESNVGASHRRCNRTAGGKLGAKKTNAKKRRAVEGGDYFAW